MSKRVRNDRKPFLMRIFYLDISNNPGLKCKLSFCIKNLGGTVEEFLDKKVRYVVTDRAQKDWPSGRKLESDRASEGKQGEGKVDLLTLARGKRLTLKNASQQPSVKSSDVLETALKLNMKILTYKSILDFCKQYMKIPNEEQVSDEVPLSTVRINQTTGVKFKQLRAPFLKFEDNEEKYQPCIKEFDAWPELNLMSASGTCPFGTLNSRTAPKPAPKPAPIAETKQVNILPQTACENANQAAPVDVKAQPQISAPNCISMRASNTTTRVLPNSKKRQRVLFCEICCKEFTNMSEHIKTEFHQQYMVNDEHYKELRSVIDSLPHFSTLDSVQRSDETSEEEESELESEIDSEMSSSEDEEEDEEDEEEEEEEASSQYTGSSVVQGSDLESTTKHSSPVKSIQPVDQTNKLEEQDVKQKVINNSVVINLNAEIKKAFGEGSLLSLHDRVTSQKIDNTTHKWQHLMIKNDGKSASNGTGDKTHDDDEPSEFVPPSYQSTPNSLFRFKHVFNDLTNDPQTLSEEL